MARRENQKRRTAPFRSPRTRLLVVCGGAVTEPRYFDGLKQAFRNPAVRIRVKTKSVDPVRLMEYAAAIRGQDGNDFDEVWCVVDVDEFDLGPAIRRSVKDGIRLAISNPCFEVWLLMHFVDNVPVVSDAADAVRQLRRYVPDYTKRELRFGRFEAGVADAIRRARGLGEVGEEQVCNPSSGVWMIAETIVG